MLKPEEIKAIRDNIIEGVNAARKAGIECGYPSDFTVTTRVEGRDITITLPIIPLSNEEIILDV